jgi:hypothetical protein
MVVLAMAFGLGASAALADDTQDTVAGVWVKHDVHFTYMGLTTFYSCDGLENKLKLLLRAAGAREDLRVSASCSNPMGGPSRISMAELQFYTLWPVDRPLPPPARSATKAEPPAAGLGVWKRVELRARTPNWLEEGDCELVDQFDRELLPLFAVRDRDGRMMCAPHTVILGGIDLKVSTLMPVAKPKAPATPEK